MVKRSYGKGKDFFIEDGAEVHDLDVDEDMNGDDLPRETLSLD